MELITVQSDNESNILVAFEAERWGFKEHKERSKVKKGTYISFYCSETKELLGIGIITADPIPGKIERNIWIDSDYYDETEFKILYKKKVSKESLQNLFGSRWYQKLNAWCSASGAPSKLSEAEIWALVEEFK